MSIGEDEMIIFMRVKSFLLYIAFMETLKRGDSSNTCWEYSSLFVGLHLNPGIIDVSRKEQMFRAWHLDRTWISLRPPSFISLYTAWSLGWRYWSWNMKALILLVMSFMSAFWGGCSLQCTISWTEPLHWWSEHNLEGPCVSLLSTCSQLSWPWSLRVCCYTASIENSCHIGSHPQIPDSLRS